MAAIGTRTATRLEGTQHTSLGPTIGIPRVQRQDRVKKLGTQEFGIVMYDFVEFTIHVVVDWRRESALCDRLSLHTLDISKCC